MSTYDQQLLDQWCLRQDAAAFKEIANRHAGLVYHTCRRILGNATDAEDVAQECFEALASAGRRPGTYLVPWLHRVATNKSLKRVRADQSRQRREEAFRPEAVSGTLTPAQRDLYAVVDEAIAQLPEELRFPIIAHFLEDQTQDAIALELGVSRQTVTYRIGKGIEAIRARTRMNASVLSAAALAEWLKPIAHVPPSLVNSLGKLALAGPASTSAAILSFFSAKALIAAILVVGIAGLASFLMFSPKGETAVSAVVAPSRPVERAAQTAASVPQTETKAVAAQAPADAKDKVPAEGTSKPPANEAASSAAIPAPSPALFCPHSCLDEGFKDGKCVFSARQFILSRAVRRSEFPNGRVVIFDLSVPCDLDLDTIHGTAVKNTYPEDRPASHSMPDEMFERLASNTKKELLGTKVIEGKECTGARVVVPGVADMTIWKDTQTGLTVRLETIQLPSDRLVVESEFNYNIDTSPERFSLTPPEGYEYREKKVCNSWWRTKMQWFLSFF